MDKTKGSIADYPQYKLIKLIGKGTFGKVYYAIDLSTQEPVAIKRSPKWRNKVSREVDLLKKMNYSKNIVNTKSIFYTTTDKGFRIQNIVFKYMTYSLGKFIRLKKQEKRENKYERIPPANLKTIIHQICLGIKNLHEHNVAHRDLKPDNILINLDTPDINVEICDLGSAKKVEKSIISIPYICSRWYRAPELLCGSMYYTTDVDLWSLGCIIFELINLCPLFPGKFKKDEYSEECSQIVNLIEVLGSPNINFYENIKDYTSTKNTSLIKELCELDIPPLSWDHILGNILEKEERDLIGIIGGLLKWDPNERLKIDEVLDNSYFSTLHI
ncbi:protein kinase, putative [Plasmodium berghei]|uniref:Protein kinase, putative n=2 Tax=Plasmodium berghei TaxID=5821 RepID=A0A509AZG7_PLABA|nr:protein kinase, putative [Plasmodium berghei ANKA]CXJ14125.1 protein kinase, putative [Plasmodium berghei]SCM26172.1 protein kinase, putative [Plasmodium berghei]SCN28315.1 protein kinase, putative [Plasmodium berghei]SCO62513.1 protein kinase, putative [Plasmodium berghei]SCO64071.1 protein kinase, putative [Plasmodium berghei]|eukprot:XP_034423967.1 protein kinase, putative [Plasmodium berghei ANKA]